MKPLFLITSALNPSYGVFSLSDRVEQTKGTIKSIRDKVPEADIFLVDVSVNVLPDEIREEMKSMVHHYMDLSHHQGMVDLSLSQAKSQSEALMTLLFLDTIQRHDDIFKKYDRIFKITGRLQLDDDFDLTKYENLHGKYVFKKRVESWMQPPYGNATHLYDTRLHSWCSSLTESHKENLIRMFEYLQYVDLEHAMFAVIPQDLVVEFDRVHCKGQVASTGEWRFD